MARILVIGDLHFSKRSLFILEKLQEDILSRIQKYKPDHVVFLGDTLDRFGNLDSTRSTEAIDFFHKITLVAKSTLLIGNHDIPNKTYFMCKNHGFTGLKYYWENITVVDEKCIEFEVNGHIFQAVPYCPNGRLQEGLSTLTNETKRPSAIFCHQEIKGCNINGFNSKSGDIWPKDSPLLVCGHIHKYHMPQSNVLYVGSPYQDNFGEEDIDKSISLLTFSSLADNKNIIEWKEQRIPTRTPKRYKLTMTGKEYESWSPSRNSLYLITVYGDQKDFKDMPKTRKIIHDGGNVIFISSIEGSAECDSNQNIDGLKQNNVTLKEMMFESIKDKDHLHPIYNLVFPQ
jgi:predicted phosphodiesterase